MIFHELLVLQGPQRLHAKVLYVFEEMLIMLPTFRLNIFDEDIKLAYSHVYKFP